MEQIDLHGVLVEGRTPRELVRNPALTPMNQARAALVHLARSVPLLNAQHDHDGPPLTPTSTKCLPMSGVIAIGIARLPMLSDAVSAKYLPS
jgi:hypothetical protein